MRRLIGGVEMSVQANDPEAIAKVQAAKGLTYAEIGRRVGTTGHFIRYFFRGERTASIEVARKVFKELGLDKREAHRLFLVDIGRPANSGRAVATTDVA